MPDNPKITEYLTVLIKRTKSPTAPLIFEQAASGIEKLGKLIAGIADKQKTMDLQQKMLDTIPSEEIFNSPEYLVACASMLKSAMIAFTNASVKQAREKECE